MSLQFCQSDQTGSLLLLPGIYDIRSSHHSFPSFLSTLSACYDADEQVQPLVMHLDPLLMHFPNTLPATHQRCSSTFMPGSVNFFFDSSNFTGAGSLHGNPDP
eukprot:767262-Hanusia_phi.AAC.4